LGASDRDASFLALASRPAPPDCQADEAKDENAGARQELDGREDFGRQ
jgi:hypothetical protein